MRLVARPSRRLLSLLALPLLGCAVSEAEPPATRAVSTRGALMAVERAQIDVFGRTAPSVVFITTVQAGRGGLRVRRPRRSSGSGTGFVWDARGHLVTNYHVIRGAKEIEVTLADGTAWPAEVVGHYADKDVAVLRIQPKTKLRPISLGSSSDLEVGQNVLAIGNPFRLDHTLTTGVVSALGREIEAGNRRVIEGVIQTDAAINPGNSGGPLLDSAGRVVGINTAILNEGAGGIGFAVPIDTVRRVVRQLIAHGRVLRPILGVRLAPRHMVLRSGVRGALIGSVEPGTGAARAGLKGMTRRGQDLFAGDIIVGIAGRTVRRSDDLLNQLEEHKAGETVELQVYRDGQTRSVKVVLGRRQ